MGGDDMSSRNEVDKKNNERMNKILSNYPSIVGKYIDSMPRKTSFTKAFVFTILQKKRSAHFP